MPICKHEGFENFSKNPKQDTFHDNEEVFYCETTRQIFRDYEEYFRHVMVINSTIWQCEATKRENLTYAEALKSERRARKKMEQFKDCLRPVVMLVVEKAQQSSMKILCRLVYDFIRNRFFVNEDVEALNNSSSYLKYVVVSILPMSPSKSPPAGGAYDPDKVSYKLQKVGGNSNGKEIIATHDCIRRSRVDFSHENLRMFIADNVTRVEGLLRPKPDAYKKYVTDRKVTFAKLFIGKIPHYEPSKRMKAQLDVEKKQTSMAKYLTKNGLDSEKTAGQLSAEQEERSKSLLKKMERLKKEKEEKQAEMERKKAERLAKIEEEASALARISDDLERLDQKPLPKFKPVCTQIPTKYFGNCIMLQEFMHSFVGILSGINVFKNNISFYELTRAFTTREVAGPLSDIVLVLLGSIFELQQEEESECAVEYVPVKNKEREPYATMALANKTHKYIRRHFFFKLNELPLDAQTVSEVLRLHFLASGAQVNEKAERWRVMYRNGYYSSEDPGLRFRMQQPHVLRALQMYTVYQLPVMDIFRIIQTLLDQILTYSSTINVIEERIDQTTKSKMELRALMAAENRRLINFEAEKKKLLAAYANELVHHPGEAEKLKEKLNKQLEELSAQSNREKKKFDSQLEKLHSSLFDFMVYLGMDRAYRNYYVLESLPGVFVEHTPSSYEKCLLNPPQNVPQFVGFPKTRKEIKLHLSRLYKKEKETDIKGRKSQGPVVQDSNKENKENQVVTNGEVKMNGNDMKMDVDGEDDADPIVPADPPTQYELMMCTGDPKNCIVHDEKNPDRQQWSFFHTDVELDELINSLNPLGERESELRKQLTTMRALISSHIKQCPVDMLSAEKVNSNKLSRFKVQMRDETRKKYNAANFGLPENTDLNEVMHAMLVDRILQLEIDITTGDLGRLKVKDIEKWRIDVQNNTYDSQGELKWGSETEPHRYKDPGVNLGDKLDIDSEDSADEGISLHDSPALRQCVKNLASALLQIEQGIEQRFLQEPFGIKKEFKDKEKMDALVEKGRSRLKDWELSLMHATSYSQVFLHLSILHGAIKWQRSTNKSSCQICRRMTEPEKMLLCDECNAGTHMFCMKPKMKTVPQGNWYCRRCVNNLGLQNEPSEETKKKSRKRAFVLEEEDNASEGSQRSTNRRSNKIMRRSEIEEELNNGEETFEVEGEEEFEEAGSDIDGEEEEADEEAENGEETLNNTQDEEEESEEESESTEEDDDEICAKCSYNGVEVSCQICKGAYHLDCVNLKKPKRTWTCSDCKSGLNKKRRAKQNGDITEDEDFDQPLVKRSRTSTSKRSSARNSMNDINGGNEDAIRTANNNNSSRRSRRTGDHLPLNSSVLYDLLDDIMKHDSSWPFLRPVSHSEVPDYHTIIKEPMDFAKVKSKLNMGKYTINEELLKDIELVFKNCDIYNQQGNEIYEAGSSLERFVMDRCKSLNLPFQPSDMNRS